MRIAVIALCVALGGCSTTQQVDQVNAYRSQRDRECASKGYKPGTQDWTTCQQVVAMNQNATAGMATSVALLPLSFLGAFISDVRLKEDVVKVGQLDNGLGLYRFRYLGAQQQFVGVLAQEVERVRPEAVIRGSDGYLRVRYAAIGARMMTWETWLAR